MQLLQDQIDKDYLKSNIYILAQMELIIEVYELEKSLLKCNNKYSNE